jgi:antitoxin VapB
MDEARLFQNGQSQAVRLPKAFRFEGDTVYIKRHGKGVLLLPKTEDPWDIMAESLNEFDEDFVLRRDDTELQERPPIDPARRTPRSMHRKR